MRLREILIERITDPTAPNPALLTWEEYLKVMNPDGKMHPSSAYNHTVEEMNQRRLGSSGFTKMHSFDYQIGEIDGVTVIVDPRKTDYINRVVGYIEGNTLRGINPLNSQSFQRSLKFENIPAVVFSPTKYPGQEFYRKKFAENKLTYTPTLVNRIVARGERFEIRKNKSSFIVYNQDNLIVAYAENEWGAILVAVAAEYRSYGLGVILGKLFREKNPHMTSGGFTNAGLTHAKRVWSTFVREYLQSGEYSKLVRAGQLTTARVKEILSELPDQVKPKAATRIDYTNPDDWVVYMDGSGLFIVYHKSATEISSYDYTVWEPYIQGLSFLRVFEPYGHWHFQSIEYSSTAAEMLLLRCTLTHMLEDSPNEWLVIDRAYSDQFDSLEKLSGIEVQNGKVRATRPLIDLRQLARKEQRVRKTASDTSEFLVMLHEAAEFKYR